MSGSRVIEVHAGGRCAQRCPGCDCHSRPSSLDWGREALQGGASRVLLRGDLLSSPRAAEWLALARKAGGAERVVRTHGLGVDESAALRLARAGVTGVLVPLHSHHPQVHDRLSGRTRALASTLSALEHFSRAGLDIELEVLLLPSRLQEFGALFDLVLRVVSRVRLVHFCLPRLEQPPAVAPEPWGQARSHLLAGLKAAEARSIPVEMGPSDAIPLCALREHPALHGAYRLSPRGHERSPGTTLLPACERCVVKKRCAGVAASYAAAHGERDLLPFEKFPKTLSARRRKSRESWSEARRAGAKSSRLLVLRPTVNCNQDCTFCSANETTGNVWAKRREMLGQISRAASRGVERVSFSGGEPTLSPDLALYVRAAKRLGIPSIEIVTNGVLLDSQKRLKPLVDAGLDEAFVSLHAHDETLSQALTRKVGDFERTVRAVELLLESGVSVTLNHVVNARNHRFLRSFVEFVHARFGGRARISFAFVTPQYKALESPELVPRLSEVMPDLRRAMHVALALGQPFVVGSRQGVPPCFLGEFQGWSDLFQRSSEAASEDSPQKTKGPRCGECRFNGECAGVWKPYAERFGLDELVPVSGAPLSGEERALVRPDQMRGFDDLPVFLRQPAAEREGRRMLDEVVNAPVSSLHLPLVAGRSRPLRVLMLGAGQRARTLASAMQKVAGLSLDAVASPHAPEASMAPFGDCPAFRTPEEALEAMRPEAVVIASATLAHAAQLRLLFGTGIPLLVEKPLALDAKEARALALEGRESRAIPATNLLFSAGLCEQLGRASGEVFFSWRVPRTSASALLVWSKAGLAEMLHHVLSVLGFQAGALLAVEEVAFAGTSPPSMLRLTARYEQRLCRIELDFDALEDELSLLHAQGEWRRRKGIITTRDEAGERRVEGVSDLEAMLAHFREVVLGRQQPLVTLSDAARTQEEVERAMDSLESAGVPLLRPFAPKHVASRGLGGTLR